MSSDSDYNARFEALGRLYERRFGRLRPGKSESPVTGRSANDPENVAQFRDWVENGSALDDALDQLASIWGEERE